jgi:hypothetical protein
MDSIVKVGDRVRVTNQNHVKGYQLGDKGKVIWGPYNPASSKGTYYLVRMDKNPAPNGVTFFPDEIERDL